jgi:hypothetical protein
MVDFSPRTSNFKEKNRRERATQISGFLMKFLVELDGIEPTTS